MWTRALFFFIWAGLLFAAQAQTPTPLLVLPSANAVTSVARAYALLPSGELVVLNPSASSLSLVNLRTRALTREVALGFTPQRLLLMPERTRLAVLSDGAPRVAVLDVPTLTITRLIDLDAPLPSGTSAQGMAALSASRVVVGLPDRLVEVDLLTGETTPTVRALAPGVLLAAWGPYRYRITDQGIFEILGTGSARVTFPLPTDDRLHRVGTSALDARSGLLYVPLTLRPTADSELLPFDAQYSAVLMVVDLALPGVRRWIRLELADGGWHLPSSVVLNADRTRLLVTYAASNRLSVLDVRSGQRVATSRVGAHPIDAGFSADAQLAFTVNTVDVGLTLLDGRLFGAAESLPTTTQIPDPLVSVGARWFYTAEDPRIAWNHSLSCHTCHAPRGLLPVDVPQSNAELAAFLKVHIVNAQGGSGLSNVDLAALIAYLQSLPN
jgi:DNA-binding beta-propeller fold protein YncE